MRKIGYLALALATALAGFAVVPAAAQSPNDTKLRIKAAVFPTKAGTKRNPRGVKLRVKANWSSPRGIERPVVTRAIALFPRGSLYNGGKYPRCSKRTLDREGIRGCPERSIMGRASGVAWADQERTRPRVQIVNGGPRRVWFYTTLFNPAFVQEAVPGFISKVRGRRWAYRLRLVVPRSLRIVAGVPIALTSFNARAGRGEWLATTGCPRNRRWAFKVTTFFSTGGKDTFRDAVRCRR